MQYIEVKPHLAVVDKKTKEVTKGRLGFNILLSCYLANEEKEEGAGVAE